MICTTIWYSWSSTSSDISNPRQHQKIVTEYEQITHLTYASQPTIWSTSEEKLSDDTLSLKNWTFWTYSQAQPSLVLQFSIIGVSQHTAINYSHPDLYSNDRRGNHTNSSKSRSQPRIFLWAWFLLRQTRQALQPSCGEKLTAISTPTYWLITHLFWLAVTCFFKRAYSLPEELDTISRSATDSGSLRMSNSTIQCHLRIQTFPITGQET